VGTGRKFSELPVSEFACPPRIVEAVGGGVVEVVEGEDATFDCLFEAVPTPTVRWYSNGRLIPNNTFITLQRKFLIFEVTREILSPLLNYSPVCKREIVGEEL